MSQLLTQRLLLQEPELLEAATTHPFLSDAGKGTLTRHQLEAWLTQDRLYITCGYVQLMAALLHKIPVTQQGPSHPESKGFSHKFGVMSAALSNIHRELGFFEQTAADNGLRLDVTPSSSAAGMRSETELTEGAASLLHPATRNYIDHINAATHADVPYSHAIVLLWAMEEIYLRAWRFAASNRPASISTDAKPGMQRALDVLINNWTCPEFELFVDQIADLVNELPTLSPSQTTEINQIWTKTLHLEVAFWETAQE